MAEDIRIEVGLSGDDEVPVEFPYEGVTTSVRIGAVGERLFRLESVPFWVESAGFRDVVEGEWIGTTLRVLRVVERSGWRTFDYLLTSRSWINGEYAQSLQKRLVELGGYWECIFGGLLFVCMPPGNDIDPTEWVLAGS